MTTYTDSEYETIHQLMREVADTTTISNDAWAQTMGRTPTRSFGARRAFTAACAAGLVAASVLAAVVIVDGSDPAVKKAPTNANQVAGTAGFRAIPGVYPQWAGSPAVELVGNRACIMRSGDTHCGAIASTFLGPATNFDNGGPISTVVVGAAPKAVQSLEITDAAGQSLTSTVSPAPVGDYNIVVARLDGVASQGIFRVIARDARGNVLDDFRQVVNADDRQSTGSANGEGLRLTGAPVEVVFPADEHSATGTSLMVQPLRDGVCLVSDGCTSGASKLEGGAKLGNTTTSAADAAGAVKTYINGIAAPEVTRVAIEYKGQSFGESSTFGAAVSELNGWKTWHVTASGIDGSGGLIRENGVPLEAVFYAADGTVLGRSVVYAS
ncbi:MAG: hypothetical protein ACOYNI_02710 [Acidimicrobiia bacterium]